MSTQTPNALHYSNDEETPLLSKGNKILDTRNKWHEIAICLATYFAPISAGFAIGYSGCTIADLKNAILSDQQASWFASIINIGAAFGAILGGLVSDKYGRKMALLLLSLPLAIGFVLLTVPMPYVMISSRFISGLGVGMVCVCVPTYIAEISSPDLRGVLGTGFQLTLALGVFLAFLIGMFIDYQWLAVVACFFTAISSVAILFIPDSPIWLLSHGHYTAALTALTKLRGDIYYANIELNKLSGNSVLQNQNNVYLNRTFFLKSSILKPIGISLMLMIIQQYGGINAVLFFCSDIFKYAGFSKNPNLATTIIGGLQFIVTIVVSLLIERAGRKILMIVSCAGLFLSCASMGLYYYLKENDIADISGLSLGSLIAYIIFFSIGSGPIPWLMMSELIPQSVKGKASAFATFTNWMSSFIVTKIRIYMVHDLHNYGTFWIYGGINFLSVLFVICCVPETRGKSLEEIEELFSKPKQETIQNEYTGI